MESYNKINGGSLVRLSPQHLVDCASNEQTGNAGCNGGHPMWTWPWLQENGIARESNYPYQEEEGVCNKAVRGPLLKVKQGWAIEENKFDLRKGLMKGPVTVSVNADHPVFRDYASGIIDSPLCDDEVGHAVLAIGFGKDKIKGGYVIIKNSWGKSWGEDGFAKISLNTDFYNDGTCGILQALSFAEFKGGVPLDDDDEEDIGID